MRAARAVLTLGTTPGKDYRPCSVLGREAGVENLRRVQHGGFDAGEIFFELGYGGVEVHVFTFFE